MPAEGVPLSETSTLLSTAEMGRLAALFARMGVTKVRLTGGEPTLRNDLVDICGTISSLPGIESVGMTTNGVALMKSDLLTKLVDAGMTSMNISLDTIDPGTFEALTRRPAKTIYRVLDAIALAATFDVKVKVNCVVMRGSNDHLLADFVRHFLATDLPIDVRFIEWMPFNANEWKSDILVSADDIVRILGDSDLPLVPLPPEDPNDTTRWFSVGSADPSSSRNNSTRVGIISSMTQHFCGGCNRVRLTADGALKTCLFGDDALSLRDLMRQGYDDQHLADAVTDALAQKHFAHGGKTSVESLARRSDENRPMILIGG